MTEKTFEGKILSINQEKRMLALDGGEILTWDSSQDSTMSKYKTKYGCKVRYEGEKLVDIQPVYPDNKGYSGGKSGGGKAPYQPRNDKLILLQSCLKAEIEMYCHCTQPGTQNFDKAMDICIERAITDTKTLLKEGTSG